jgi:hypothetical protein
MVEPSVHPESGETYRWKTPLPAAPSLIPVLPTEFLRATRGRGATGAFGPSRSRDDWEALKERHDGLIPESCRHDYLVHIARRIFLAQPDLRDPDALTEALLEIRDTECAPGQRLITDEEILGIAEWVFEHIEPIDPALSPAVFAAIGAGGRLADRWYGDVTGMRNPSTRAVDWFLARRLEAAGVPDDEIVAALAWRWAEGPSQEAPDPMYFWSLVRDFK